MARLFNDASSEYLNIATSIGDTQNNPVSISCWFYDDDGGGADRTMVQIQDDGFSNRFFQLSMGLTAGAVSIEHRFGSQATVETSNTSSTNTWHHAFGEFASNVSRTVWLDADDVNKGTNSTDIAMGTNDSIDIGRQGDTSPGGYWSGRLAECAVWLATLTLAEITALSKGYSPLLIKPADLVFYLPMIRDNDNDLIGGLALTAFNTPSIADHTSVIYPTMPYIMTAPAVAGIDFSAIDQLRQSGGMIGVQWL